MNGANLQTLALLSKSIHYAVKTVAEVCQGHFRPGY